MTRPDPWIVIVPPAPLREADAAFERWLSSQGLNRTDLDPNALRIDDGLGPSGLFRCYQVRRNVLRELAASYLRRQIGPGETVLADAPERLVTDRRILFVWRLHWPPHTGEWTHDGIAFDEITRW